MRNPTPTSSEAVPHPRSTSSMAINRAITRAINIGTTDAAKDSPAIGGRWHHVARHTHTNRLPTADPQTIARADQPPRNNRAAATDASQQACRDPTTSARTTNAQPQTSSAAPVAHAAKAQAVAPTASARRPARARRHHDNQRGVSHSTKHDQRRWPASDPHRPSSRASTASSSP